MSLEEYEVLLKNIENKCVGYFNAGSFRVNCYHEGRKSRDNIWKLSIHLNAENNHSHKETGEEEEEEDSNVVAAPVRNEENEPINNPRQREQTKWKHMSEEEKREYKKEILQNYVQKESLKRLLPAVRREHLIRCLRKREKNIIG
uniref:Uncharacterized protein n=1 Tax=Caenorhabditis tropicalis TaxID=1561998 RepID=A0A1I7TFX2_9PELO